MTNPPAYFAVLFGTRTVRLSVCWLVLILLGTMGSAHAQFHHPPAAEWSTLALTSARALSIARTNDGFIVAGIQTGDPWPFSWAAMVKLDPDGNIVESETFETEPEPNAAQAVIWDGSGYVIAGYQHTEHGVYKDPDVWLMKTNTSLGKQWGKTYGSAFPDFGYALTQDDNGLVIGGWHGIGGPSGSGYLIRTDAAGELDWDLIQDVGDPSTHWINATIRAVQPTSDDGYILATDQGMVKVLKGSGGDPPALVWKYNTAIEYYGVREISPGQYIGVGKTLEAGSTTSHDIILSRVQHGIDPNTGEPIGQTVWETTFGSNIPTLNAEGTDDIGNDVIQTADGGFAVIGSTQSYGWHGGWDAWLILTDSEGNLLWEMSLGDSGNDYGNAIVEADDPGRNLVIAGSAQYEGTQRMWIMKLPRVLPLFMPSFTPPPPVTVYAVEEPIFFEAAVSPPTHNIINWEWEFGDGVQGAGQQTAHAFISGNTFSVNLYATDANDLRIRTSNLITVDEARGLQQQWERSYGVDDWDFGHDIIGDPDDGGFIITGSKHVGSSSYLWYFKTDARGRLLPNWDKQMTLANSGRSIINAHNNEGYIITGYNSAGSDRNVWLMKVDETGDMVWSSWGQLISADMQEGFDVARWEQNATGSKGYIVTGYSGLVPKNLLVIKIPIDDATQEPDWGNVVTNTIPDPGGLNNAGHAVAQTADGGFIVTGGYDSEISGGPVLTVKTDFDLVETWRSNVGPVSKPSGGRGIFEIPDGYVVAGLQDDEFVLLKLTPDGVLDWRYSYGNGRWQYLSGAVAATSPNHGYLLVGNTILDQAHFDQYRDDLYLLRTDGVGNTAWERTLRIWTEGVDPPEEEPSYPPHEEGQTAVMLPHGGIVILSALGFHSGPSTWLLKLGPNFVPTVGTIDYTPGIPRAGEPVFFSTIATDLDGVVVNYEWDFGDASGYHMTGNDSAIDHTFFAPGTYTVKVAAIDDDGGEGLAEPITVAIAPPPVIGDLDGNAMITLADAILALQVVAGINPPITFSTDLDVDGDQQVGLREAIYDLQILGLLRFP